MTDRELSWFFDPLFYEQFEETVKNDAAVKEHFEKGDLKAAEEYIKSEIFNKPEKFFSLEKLRRAIHIDRRISLREIIEKAFGRIDRFKAKDELLDEELDKFISIYKPQALHLPEIKNFFKAYITDTEIRDIMEKKEYNRLAVNAKITLADLKTLGRWRDIIPEYVKDYVRINTFM